MLYVTLHIGKESELLDREKRLLFGLGVRNDSDIFYTYDDIHYINITAFEGVNSLH